MGRARRAHAAIDAIAERGSLPSSSAARLYLRAARTALALPPAVSSAERQRWERFYDERGGAGALAELTSRDQRAAGKLHANDRRRVVRALDLASAGASLAPQSDRLWDGPLRRAAVVAVVSWPRPELRARIAARTGAMLEGGAVDEVEAQREGGLELSPTASRILGLAQIGAYLDGRATSSSAAPRLRCAAASTRAGGKRGRVGSQAIELAGADSPSAPTACWS